ncbi:DEAD/DEAH box helicase [Mangrovicoccus sp. HB161399]|uniref:DEAD/DEAH box helicase n=1 Tax=Mangrovicoccus sp. HB161399 TaxID=2720392 RepID=UPI0015562608|nr:DEAD/DEAH box helicase [Mangrovicoccus sp. HB161399]
MTIRLQDHFDPATLARGLDYARRGLVVSVAPSPDGMLDARVSNGRGKVYLQQIRLDHGRVAGDCACPVGWNCKHVAAALAVWAEQDRGRPALALPVQGWLGRLRGLAPAPPPPAPRSGDYPPTVKDRLLYVLAPAGPQAGLRIDIHKGRINAAGTALNKSIRRYDAMQILRNPAPAQFVRPADLELLPELARARLWEVSWGYGYGLPEPLRPRGDDLAALVRRLCATGRFLHGALPDAQLGWSEDRPEARLDWRMETDGRQRLVFAGKAGAPLDLRSLGGTTLWVDAAAGRIGCLDRSIQEEVLQLVQSSPRIVPEEAAALGTALPETLGGAALPRPRTVRQALRAARQRFARLTLGAETAREDHRRYGHSVELPVLTLRFVYDGQEVWEGDADPRLAEDGTIVTIARDHGWEAACAGRLMRAGALPVEEMELHWPGDRMAECDFVFAEGEINMHAEDLSGRHGALDFAFRELPALRRDGWEIVETRKWPYRLSSEAPVLSVSTQGEAGEAFQGNDWFSLGFRAEIGGREVDVAPLIAAFLEQARTDWEDLPDAAALAEHLAARPVYLDRGKDGYVALNLAPLAPLLHLFLSHHAELGALHPSDAETARLAEEALEGSSVRFADHAGILPLARSLQALAAAESFRPPGGLEAELRGYQARGAAWMGSLLAAGFGGILADDMGLGKTVQTLALLLARKEAGAAGPALLIVPTSLVHGWQSQAAQFAPGLRLVTLHGPDRAARREAAEEADLVLTTYPLLARDRSWLAARDWPLAILDEAQTLKNPAAQTAKALREIPAEGRLALTGTPLENSLADLWTLADWVNPGLLGDRKTFQKLFRTPIEKQGDRAAQARLNRRLRPFLLRRTKEQVAAELPPKTEILERVELPKPQQALYETVRSAMDARVREAIAARGLAAARITVLDALLKLRQVCCDPALVKTEAARSVSESAKRARLRELLAELVAEGRRVLVFSQFVEMLRLIEADMAAAGITSLSLTGGTRDRAAVLGAFARGDAPVFLLSLKAGGVGLTLTEADTVILCDPWWNPAVERQAMDRAHRIGQTRPVFIHRLVAAGTVEEKILEMQVRKQALADALFEDGAGGTDALLDEAALQDLFAPLAP